MLEKKESLNFPRDGTLSQLGDPRKDYHYLFGGRWVIFGENFESYLDDFSRVDRDGRFSHIIEDIAAKPKPVIIDLMAPTNTLADFSFKSRNCKSMKALAVGYGDTRHKTVKKVDEMLGINYISTDLANIQNFNKISEWLGNDRADLIMERGYGGLSYIPTNLDYQYRVINKIWEMLSPDGGLTLLQLPSISDLYANDIHIGIWINNVKQSGIYCQYLPSYVSKDAGVNYGILALQKNSPAEKLPTIHK